MIRISEVRLPLSDAEAPEAPLRKAALDVLGLPPDAVTEVRLFKRSFDARKA